MNLAHTVDDDDDFMDPVPIRVPVLPVDPALVVSHAASISRVSESIPEFTSVPVNLAHIVDDDDDFMDPVPVRIPVLPVDPALVVSHAASISRVSESIPESIPTCEDLFHVFIPTCEDLVIGSEDEYDSERDDGNLVVQQVPSVVRNFLPHNVKESTLVESGGRRRSKGTENWASNTFNEWRSFRGFPISKSLADLSELPDVKPLAAMLKDFFLECVKKDGTMYPPSS